jgi:hypothetical protein
VQNAKRMKVVETEQDLAGVAKDDGLGEGPVLVQEVGNRSSRHPLDEEVDCATLLYCAEHPNNVPERKKLKAVLFCFILFPT